MSGNSLKKEFGDYQTPSSFAKKVCRYLKNELQIEPKYIFEPTAGVGNFIQAGIECFKNAAKVYGVEINPEYCKICENKFDKKKVSITCNNFFSYNSSKLIEKDSEFLVIGNPPWATNSELNFNLPEKVNLKKYSGIDAMTGASNFDICEYIILKLIREFNNTNTTIAMLCKTSVARNVLLELERNNILTDYVKILNFDSAKVFEISVASCLFVIKLSSRGKKNDTCEIFDINDTGRTIETLMIKRGGLASVKEGVLDLEGSCQLEWRQGVKHDCASVMELIQMDNGIYVNKRKEQIELENVLVFPLIKSSAIKMPVINRDFKKHVIVTQKKAREDTSFIEQIAPKTWKYLKSNQGLFDGRKSSIYSGAPTFSMFGVGDYSYAPYKVGVSGFYKKPLFTLLYNVEKIKKPVMLDDTAYFLSFNDYEIAYACMLLLNSAKVQKFLHSISFQDAKRPYTKKVLQRLDLKKSIENIGIDDMIETENTLKLGRYISNEGYKKIAEYISGL